MNRFNGVRLIALYSGLILTSKFRYPPDLVLQLVVDIRVGGLVSLVAAF